MKTTKRNAVTGAYGYTGKYITRKLLAKGEQVITLTGNPDRPSPFNGQVPAYNFDFDNPARLVETLRGLDTLYNTYWVRFDHGDATHSVAVKNTRILLDAAVEAGVRRIVHVSITNPDANSPLPYFHGKALLEQAVMDSGLSYTILRPAVIFGPEDILINNITWLLRRFPAFAIPGDGSYGLQPIFVGDMATLAVDCGASAENAVIDAIGPETFSFDELVKMLRAAVGARSLLLHTPPRLALSTSKLLSFFIGDVLLTDDELVGLMDDLLVVDSPPAGTTRLSDWARENAVILGAEYHSEIRRHYVGGSDK
ncbi:MAG: NAD(P)H-binding protein [Anaerolineales bacterium]|nr:NAD(P)H-binding protein [Anaerolineales bacterium]